LDLCIHEVQSDLEALATRELQFREKLSSVQHDMTTHVTECLRAMEHFTSQAESLRVSLGQHVEALEAHLHETMEHVTHEDAELTAASNSIQHKQADVVGTVGQYVATLSRAQGDVRHHIESGVMHVTEVARQEITHVGQELEHTVTAEVVQHLTQSAHVASDTIGRLAETSSSHAHQLLSTTSTSMQDSLVRLNNDANAKVEEINHTVSTLSQAIGSTQTRITTLISDLHRAGDDVELGVSTVNTGLETALGIFDEVRQLFSRFG
jgi:chromosome segregation ATPase